jgi:hypothetical protein
LRAPSLTRYAPKPLIRAGQHSYAATLEALLVGHEDWVHSVSWHPRVPAPSGGGATTQPACLLSASMDRTMVLWRPDAATGDQGSGEAGAAALLASGGMLPAAELCGSALSTVCFASQHGCLPPRCSKQRACYQGQACCQSQRNSNSLGAVAAGLWHGRPPRPAPLSGCTHIALTSSPEPASRLLLLLFWLAALQC